MESRFESIDTNALLRLILNDDQSSLKKVIRHLLCHNVEYRIDDYVFGEIEFVLAKCQFKRAEIVAAISQISANPIFKFNKERLRKVFSLYIEHPSLSFNDCYLAIKSEEMDTVPIWTLDKKFANQAGQAALIG